MKRILTLLTAAVMAITLISASKISVRDKRYLVTEFGARGDSGTQNTKVNL